MVKSVLPESSPRRVLIMAAGTGGHVFPALAVARALQADGVEVHWLVTPHGMEQRLLADTDIVRHPIQMQGLRGNGLLRLLKTPAMLLAAVLAALRVIRQIRADAVVGFGGYVTAPGGLAARLAGVPLLIHEQNAIAGMSNRQLARFAVRVMQAFPHTFESQPKLLTTGNPVRAEIVAVPEPGQRYAGRTGPIRVLVIGGSLGAQVLNERVPEALGLLARQGHALQVRHQCGQNQLEGTSQRYAAVPDVAAEVVPFVKDMAQAYAECDLLICRAGALTVTEVATAGVPAIFVPLPHAVDDHQTANARHLADQGAALLCPQATLTPEHLAAQLQPLLDRGVLLDMALKARQQAQPDATARVTEQVLAVVKKTHGQE